MKTQTHLNTIFQLQENDVVKKKFDFEGTPLLLIERDEFYMNNPEPMRMCRAIAQNSIELPISFRHRQTLKSMVEQTLLFIYNAQSRGINVQKELTKQV